MEAAAEPALRRARLAGLLDLAEGRLGAHPVAPAGPFMVVFEGLPGARVPLEAVCATATHVTLRLRGPVAGLEACVEGLATEGTAVALELLGTPLPRDLAPELVQRVEIPLPTHVPAALRAVLGQELAGEVLETARALPGWAADRGADGVLALVPAAEGLAHLATTVAWAARLGIRRLELRDWPEEALRLGCRPARTLPPGDRAVHEHRLAAALERQGYRAPAAGRPGPWGSLLDALEAVTPRGMEEPASQQPACRQVGVTALVRAEGPVHACLRGCGEGLLLGDLRHQSWEAVWGGPQAQALRRELDAGRPRGPCAGCRWGRAGPWAPGLVSPASARAQPPKTSLQQGA